MAYEMGGIRKNFFERPKVSAADGCVKKGADHADVIPAGMSRLDPTRLRPPYLK